MSGRTKESTSQRNERLEAERIAADTKAIADREKELQLKKSEETEQKKKDLATRSKSMAGGGREGLMYKGSNVGAQK